MSPIIFITHIKWHPVGCLTRDCDSARWEAPASLLTREPQNMTNTCLSLAIHNLACTELSHGWSSTREKKENRTHWMENCIKSIQNIAYSKQYIFINKMLSVTNEHWNQSWCYVSDAVAALIVKLHIIVAFHFHWKRYWNDVVNYCLLQTPSIYNVILWQLIP